MRNVSEKVLEKIKSPNLFLIEYLGPQKKTKYGKSKPMKN
jgi:hypothetical protein